MRETHENWQKILARGFKHSTELLQYLGLDENLGCQFSEQQFVTRVPLGFAKRMTPGDSNDPLLRQVLASPLEQIDVPGFEEDPLHEREYNPVKGMIHKYQSRVLMTLTGACAINCRYCFRRHFPYGDNNPGREGWSLALQYIQEHSELNEVILSGGDPLLASDKLIESLLLHLQTLKHIQTLRIHTRIPIVLPERIDEAFLSLFQECSLQKVMVLHTNHPQEIDETVANACQKLRQAGFYLLNQSVLLRGINDEVHILSELSQKLFSIGVLPYYLHVLDKVKGAAHFDVDHGVAKTLFQALQTQLPGYLIPRLAQEVPGVLHKTLIF